MGLLTLIPLPYRLLMLAAFAAALYGSGYVFGLNHEKEAWQAADASHALQDTKAQLVATKAARARETALRNQLDAAAAKRLKENADHEAELANLRAAARARTERLRCPAAALPADPAPDHSGPASGPVPETRPGELVPGAADALFRIAASIGQGVRERNALIDAYNAARTTCNAPNEPKL